MSQPFATLLAEQAVQQFFKQWHAGLQPCLSLETHSSGAIFVSSNVTAGVTLPKQTENVFPPPLHARHQPRQHRRPPGPSRLRRRERRAQARELAAAQAVPKKTPNNSEAAVQATASPPARCDAAVQAVASSPARVVASAAPAVMLNPRDEPAAVQASPPHGGPDGPLQVLLRQIQGEQYVKDTFCSDRDYFEKQRRDDEERKKQREADLENIRRMINGD